MLPDGQLLFCCVDQVTARGKSLATVSRANGRDQSSITYGQCSYAVENRNSDDIVPGCYLGGDLCEYGRGGRVAFIVQAGHRTPMIVIAYVTGEYDACPGAGGRDGEPNLIDGDRSLHDVAELD